MIEQKDLTRASLADRLLGLARDSERRHKGARSSAFAERRRATVTLAEVLGSGG